MRRQIKAMLHGMANVMSNPVRQLPDRADQLFILTWHSFAKDWQGGLMHALPGAMFARQLDWLQRHFEIVALEQALSVPGQGSTYGSKPRLALTIDDGYDDNHAIAYPLLAQCGIPATIFVATQFIDEGLAPWTARLRYILQATEAAVVDGEQTLSLRTMGDRANASVAIKRRMTALLPAEREIELARLASQLRVADWAHAIAPMTWDQLRELDRNGITIGAHSHFHSILPAMPIEEATRDLVRSKERIEAELGRACMSFAYPDGKHDEPVRQAVQQAGFACAVTQDRGTNGAGADMFMLKRIDIPHHDPFATFQRRVCLP